MTRSALIQSAVAVFAVVVAALLVPVPFGGRALTALGDLVHAPLFGVLVFAVLVVWQRLSALRANQDQADVNWRSLLLRAAVAGSALVLFGIAMEFAQNQSGRSGSMHDAVANALGIVAGTLVYFALHAWKTGNRIPSGSLLLAALAVWCFAWSAPIRLLTDAVRMPNEFPMLASFESNTELTRWLIRENSILLVGENVTDGDLAAQIRLTDRRFPAITLVELVPDWSKFSQLEIDVTLLESESNGRATGFVKLIDEPRRGRSGDRFVETFPLVVGQPIRVRVDLDELSKRYGDDLVAEEIIFVDIGVLKEDIGATIAVDRITLSNPQ